MSRSPTGTRASFVVLDGPDGTGKSTQARLLVESLRKAGSDPLHLRDPGSTPLAEGVRRLLLDPSVGEITPAVEALLFTACRAEMVERSIRPALAAKRDIVCERFVSSTLVYQGSLGGVDAAWIEALTCGAIGSTRPDRVIVLDLSADEALRRRSRRTQNDRFESRGVDYQRKVREAFLALASSEPSVYAVVSAEGTPDEVAARVRTHVADLFPRLSGAAR